MVKFIVNSRILVILEIMSLIHSQIGVAVDPLCYSKLTCGECIQTPSCAWCMKADFNNKPRCVESLSASLLDCSSHDVYDPDGSINISDDANPSQFFPKRVRLTLRPNQHINLKLTYSQVNHPVDLYYLMDLTKSMEDDKETLAALGDLLASTMKNITLNFRLGFGSFVDKALMPYVSTLPKRLRQPCYNCDAPYGYHNIMPLTMDTHIFADQINATRVSGGLDKPEGGLDAIMQAVVCRKEIGWRELAHRFLIFSTDSSFHYAGDGKLGGVITPNDGQCHLDINGDYTFSTVQDYPSISQINLKVKQNAINVIFAVTATEHEVYKKLSQHVESSSCVVLAEDSSNIVTLIKEEYMKLTSDVEIKDSSSNPIEISYWSACLEDGEMMPTNKCDGLKVGDVVDVIAEIHVTKCPQNPSDWKQTFQIYPVGINETLTVDLEILCDCPCEKKSIPNSPVCQFHGTYKCGICECNQQFYGKSCECLTADIQNKPNGGCRENILTPVDCNGRGTCVCGICTCDKRTDPNEIITGEFCECDNFSCYRNNSIMCSGPTNGVCECGTCRCLQGWTGSACECPSIDMCKLEGMTENCSGNGECVCGKCRCNIMEQGHYSGQFCEKFKKSAIRCKELKDCVQCQLYGTGPLKGEKCVNYCSTLFTATTAKIIMINEDQDEHLCSFYDDDVCKYQFVYSEKEANNLKVRAQETRECPSKLFIVGIMLAIIMEILFIGLGIIFLWKLVTTIYDRREFARFEKTRMMQNQIQPNTGK